MLTMAGGASAQWISHATFSKVPALIFLALSTRRVPCTSSTAAPARLGLSAAPVHRRVAAVLAFLENAPPSDRLDSARTLS